MNLTYNERKILWDGGYKELSLETRDSMDIDIDLNNAIMCLEKAYNLYKFENILLAKLGYRHINSYFYPDTYYFLRNRIKYEQRN